MATIHGERNPAPPKKTSAGARAFGAETSIFVPPALQGKKKPPPKRSVVLKKEKPKLPTAAELRADRASKTRARERVRLGLKTTAATGPNRLDAVPEKRSSKRVSILGGLASIPSRIPGTDIGTKAIADAIGDLGKSAYDYGAGDLYRDIDKAGKAVQHGFTPRAPVQDILTGKVGLESMPAVDWATSAKALDAVLGKSIPNLFVNTFHDPLGYKVGPKEIGSIGASAAAILPVGRIPKLIFGIRTAAKANQAEKLFVKAARDVAKTSTPEEIATSRTEIQAKIDHHIGEVKKIHEAVGDEYLTPGAIRNIRQHVDEIQNLHVHNEILKRAEGQTGTAFQGWSPKQTAPRVQSKLNPRNVAKGIAYKNPTVLNSLGIHVAGPVTPEQWVEKILAAFPTLDERQHWATWYEHFAPAFRETFGPLADDLMRGFAVSQANNSPTGGMLATLRVLDRLQRGDSTETISHLGIGTRSLVKTIAKAVEGKDGKVDVGVAAKLSDFIDSFLQKDTRTWMGDHPLGGKPAAVDVHALRDVGLIDKKLVNKLEKVHGLKLGKDFVVDSQGAASGPLYERVSEKYTEFADHLNAIAFDGRTNWKPSEAQALGWGATQKTHGVDPEDLMSAFQGNTRQFNVGLGELGADMTAEETRSVLDAIRPEIQRMIDETPNAFPEGEIGYGYSGAAGKGENGSLHFEIQSSPEVAQSIADRMAATFRQYDVQAAKIGGSGAKPTLRIAGIPDEETAGAVYAALLEADPKRFKAGFKWVGGRMQITMPGKQITVEAQAAFHAEMAPLISAAADAAGVPHVQYDGVNLQILKGKTSGESDVLGSGGARAKRAVAGNSDTKAARALDAALKRVDKARADPSQQGLISRLAREETGSLGLDTDILGIGGTKTLDEVLAGYNPRELTSGGKTQQMQGARGRAAQAIERGADRVSRSLEPDRALGFLGDLPLFSNASATGRVMRHAGRELAQESTRARGVIRQYEKLLPKKAETPEDIAHFWWAQLPPDYRNADGLQLVRDKWNENYMALRDGSTMDGLLADLDEIESEMAAWYEEQKLLPPAERKPPYHLMQQKGVVRYAIKDVPVLLESMPGKIARLDSVIAHTPELDPEIIRGLQGIADSREKVLFETGALDPELAFERNGLVAEWLGLEPSGQEIYMGHRIGKVRGSNPGALPAKYALGRPRSASGIGRANRLILVNNARARETTHIAIDDWLSSQTFKQGLKARQDLGAAGRVFTPGGDFDSATEVLVNPKSRSIPIGWREGGTNLLDQAVASGYDETLVRKAADGLVHAYQSIPGDEESYARVLEQAMADGIDIEKDLRVVSKAAADRYYQQFAKAGLATRGGRIYDKSVDFMVASIVFGRVGYIPKNIIQNLIMAVPHQGVFLFANSPRAASLLTAGVRGNNRAAHLADMILADVGQGATRELETEFTTKFNQAGKRIQTVPNKVANVMSGVADSPARVSAFIHEVAALDLIPKLDPRLSDADIEVMIELFSNPKYRPILNDIRSRSVEAMADFSRMTPVQRKWSRRFLIVPGWLWAGTRYPIHFAASYPGRTAAIGYVAAGEPGADRLGLPQNRPIWDVGNQAKEKWLRGIPIPEGIPLVGGKTIRTNSISPVSTPLDLLNAALQGGPAAVGENLNPLIVTLWHVANSEISSPTGSYKASEWEAIKAAIERLMPNEKLVTELVNPNENSKYYPQDATRWGRFFRELGIVPIDITVPGAAAGSSRGGGGGKLAPMPEDDAGGGYAPMPDESSGGGYAPVPP